MKALGFWLLLFFIFNSECSLAKKHLRGTKKPCTKHKYHRTLNAVTRATPHPSEHPITGHVTKHNVPSRKVKTPCTLHRHRPRKSTTPSQPTVFPLSHTTRTSHHLPSKHHKPPTTRTHTTACKETNCVVCKWSKWSKCSSLCGNAGVKQRSRKVVTKQRCGGTCPFSLHEVKSCNRVCANGGTPLDNHCTCPAGYAGNCCQKVNGNWSPWGKWKQCSRPCGSGKQQRMRSCDNPSPSNGGSGCQGATQETIGCNEQECPVNGGWSNWGPWSFCSSTCGQGQKFRLRQCSNPFPRNGGQPCIGLMMLASQCQQAECKVPVDGGWSLWGEWTSCSKTCGKGGHVRMRACNNPPPSDGGGMCSGPSKEEEECMNAFCIGSNAGSGAVGKRHVINRRLLNYVDRDVTTDFEDHVQRNIEMLSKRERRTNVNGPWTSWSSCTVTCGTGQRFRSRACQDLANPCVGVPMEVGTCKLGECTP